MAGDKFDFRVANNLVQAVVQTADALDVKNGQMEKRFMDLQDSFKDSGYDGYAVDMNAANQSIKSVITQLKVVGGKIARYAEELREATKS